MEEVLTRRLTAYLDERDRPLTERGRDRASSPIRRSCCSSTAARASSAWLNGSSDQLGLEDEIPIASLAKRFEEVYMPGRSEPVERAAAARRCSCCSGSATRPTASPTRSTASCEASG